MDIGSQSNIHHTSVIIVYNQCFIGCAISKMLTEHDFEVVANFTHLEQVADLDDDTHPTLFIIGSFETEEALRSKKEAIIQRFPCTRIVLIDAGFSNSALSAAKSQKLDAYLSLELEPDLILNGLRLVMAGNECFPKTPCVGTSEAKPELLSEDVEQLTPRENEVLYHLSDGLSNKLIARELDIAEATVKAHINSVLRKIGVTNRTQAARWALDHGLIGESCN